MMGSDSDPRRDRLWLLAVAVMLGLVSGGCADAGEDVVVRDEAPGEIQSDSETGELVTPRPGMTDLEPVEIWWEHGSWEGDLSYVMFPSQGSPCEVLDHIVVEGSEDVEGRFLITLYQGRDPDIDPAEPCDGPPRAFTVVLPAFEGIRGAGVVDLVNGADPFNDH